MRKPKAFRDLPFVEERKIRNLSSAELRDVYERAQVIIRKKYPDRIELHKVAHELLDVFWMANIRKRRSKSSIKKKTTLLVEQELARISMHGRYNLPHKAELIKTLVVRTKLSPSTIQRRLAELEKCGRITFD